MARRLIHALGLACLLGGNACGVLNYDPVDTGSSALCLESVSARRISIDLRAEFETPNSIRWDWQRDDPDYVFERWEIHLVPALKRIADSCSVHTYDATDIPELAYYVLPSPGGQMHAATTTGLVPDTEYLAQVVAVDVDGGRSLSNTVLARTGPVPVGEVVLFSETQTKGYSIPAELELVSTKPYAGSMHYSYKVDCNPGCFEHLRRQDIDVSLAAMPKEAFDRAYYEFAVATPNGGNSYWSNVRLNFTQDDGSHVFFTYSPYVLRADEEYAIMQFPLRVFASDTEPLTYDATQGGVFEFSVGAHWSPNSEVLLDEIRIRW